MKCKKLVCGCMVFMLIFWYVCMWKKRKKAKEAAPDLVLELPQGKRKFSVRFRRDGFRNG